MNLPQERQNVYPYPTATDVANAPGDRADKAARNIVSRRIDGIPKRGYIMGDCDHAPVVQGVRDLTEVCYDLLDDLELSANGGALTKGSPAARLKAMLQDHCCPEAPAEGE